MHRGDHLHVSVQFQHQDEHTSWLALPTNQLPKYMKWSNVTVPMKYSGFTYNTLKPIKISFELTDMNRQTTWLTVYDGRGVFAKSVILTIKVKDNNVVWIDEYVDYYPSIFHTGSKLPDHFNVIFKWESENVFDSVHGYPVMMEVAVLCVSVLAVGIAVVQRKAEREALMSQQFRQPKTEKAD